MNTLKTVLLNRFKILSILTISMALSLVLLMIRMKLNQSFYLLFLVWNLFLAIIPFTITLVLSNRKLGNKLLFLVNFMIWLVFLPNAPYIVTDLLHLINSQQHLMWLDILVILSFAFNGLILFYLSLFDMEQLLKQVIKTSLIKPILILIIGLTAFGVYLGRFLRFNSWEIISAPQELFSGLINLIIRPDAEVWLFTLTFGTFLGVSYRLLNYLNLADCEFNPSHLHNPEDS